MFFEQFNDVNVLHLSLKNVEPILNLVLRAKQSARLC